MGLVILAIGAHPDDIELGLGATIHKFRKEHQFHGLVLTSGSLRACPEDREQATTCAAEILGYTPHFGRLEDGAFSDIEAERTIQDKLVELKPDLVIGHSPQEYHRDHLRAYIATVSTSRRLPTLLFFEGPYSHAFTPQLYVPVAALDLKAKVAALHEHAKAVETGRYLEERNIKALAIARGAVANAAYAEAFLIDRLVLASLMVHI